MNAVELQPGEAQLNALMQEMVALYMELARDASNRSFSLPVTRAMRYIHLHIYDRCRVLDVAAHIGLNPQYFAVLFKKEAGVAPSQYITQKNWRKRRTCCSWRI